MIPLCCSFESLDANISESYVNYSERLQDSHTAPATLTDRL